MLTRQYLLPESWSVSISTPFSDLFFPAKTLLLSVANSKTRRLASDTCCASHSSFIWPLAALIPAKMIAGKSEWPGQLSWRPRSLFPCAQTHPQMWTVLEASTEQQCLCSGYATEAFHPSSKPCPESAQEAELWSRIDCWNQRYCFLQTESRRRTCTFPLSSTSPPRKENKESLLAKALDSKEIYRVQTCRLFVFGRLVMNLISESSKALWKYKHADYKKGSWHGLTAYLAVLPVSSQWLN